MNLSVCGTAHNRSANEERVIAFLDGLKGKERETVYPTKGPEGIMTRFKFGYDTACRMRLRLQGRYTYRLRGAFQGLMPGDWLWGHPDAIKQLQEEGR